MSGDAFALDLYRDRLLQLHDHICPRQVLGLRMGELAGKLLGLTLPQADKRLIAFVETDGCFADGVTVATGCSLGHRTLRLMDQGKVAVTFANTGANVSAGVRLWPHPMARLRARDLYPRIHSRWHAQLEAYQQLDDAELLMWERVELLVSVQSLIGRPHERVTCARCGEEILNQRERWVGGRALCRHCAGESYVSAWSDFGVAAADASEPYSLADAHALR